MFISPAPAACRGGGEAFFSRAYVRAHPHPFPPGVSVVEIGRNWVHRAGKTGAEQGGSTGANTAARWLGTTVLSLVLESCAVEQGTDVEIRKATFIRTSRRGTIDGNGASEGASSCQVPPPTPNNPEPLCFYRLNVGLE